MLGREFFWGLVLLGGLCVLIIYAVHSLLADGPVLHVLDGISTQILASTIVVLAFYILYMHFIGPNEGLREVTVTRPRDIKQRMEELPIDTRYYAFWGRSGSYFRSHPLLVLDEQSRKNKLVTDVDVMLPDAEDPRLIKSYEEILASLGEHPGGNALLANALATSIMCATIAENNKYIRIDFIIRNSCRHFVLICQIMVRF